MLRLVQQHGVVGTAVLESDQVTSHLCRDIFDTLDVDKSGGVSMEELSKGLVNMGYLVSEVRQASCTGTTGIAAAAAAAAAS